MCESKKPNSLPAVAIWAAFEIVAVARIPLNSPDGRCPGLRFGRKL